MISTPGDEAVPALFRAAGAVAAALLRDPRVADSWTAPSALAAFPVAGLGGHLAGQVLRLPDLPRTAAATAVPLLEHYARAAWVGTGVDSEINRGIRAHGLDTADGRTPAQLADDVDRVLADLALPGRLPTGVAVGLGSWSLTLPDFLRTRVMELVVHSDDLAVSVGAPAPAFPPGCTDLTIGLLAAVSARRHGPLALVRALSRRERAPATVAAF